jgi:fibronectin-binding autotransporter adhesin
MSQLKNQFWLRPIHFRLILGGFIIALSNDIMAQTGCPSGALTSGNQTIICNANAVINTAITTPDNNSTAVYDNVNVTVVNGTTIRLSGSPIGLASGSSVTNNGLLSSNTFFNAYGISFGVNGRSNTGGNSVTNTASGEIQTGGGNADGIIISSRLAGSLGNSAINQGLITTSGAAANGIFIRSGSSNNLVANSISNAGTISTSGASAYGISLDSTSGVNSISNTGMITTSGVASNAVNSLNTRNVVDITNSGTIQASGLGTDAINIRGAATVTNTGTITSTSGLAINFTGTVSTGKFNTLNINAGSVINGGIAFNQSSNQETLNFNSYSGTNFNNQITGLRNINLIGSSNVKMNSSAGYVLQGLGVNVNASSALEIAGVMSGSGSLTKDGTGTLTLSGDNTYTGGTVVNAGTLSGNTQSIQGNVNNNAITNFNQNSNGTYAGVMSGSGSLTKDGTGTLTLSGDNTYTGGTVVNAGTLSGNTQSIQGNVNNNAITNFNQNSNGTYAGVMSGSGSLTKDGTGTLTLSGDNTYTGGTVVNAGTLSGNTQSIQGNVNNNAITNFNQNSNGTYAGVMSGSGSLTKDGTGTLTLSGDNTYTGGTVVNAGTLSGNTQSIQGNVNNNAITNFNQNSNGTYAGVMSGSGSLTKDGTGTLTLSGDNTYTGGTVVNAGTLSGNTQSIQGNVNNNAITNFNQNSNGTYAGVMSGSGSLTKDGTGTLTLSGDNTYTGGTVVNAGTLSGNTQSIQGNVNNNAITNFNQNSNGTYAGVMSGSGSLTKDGTGTLTLSGDNTYTGGTVVNAGTLSGNTQSIQGNVNNNAITNFNQNSNGTYAGVMSGSGSLTKDGTGTLTLSGDNTYTGGTVVNAGTLSGNTQSIQGNVNNNAITNFNQNSNGTYAGVMSGSGSLTKDGTGTLTLSGDNTYTGGTVVNAGTLSGNTQSIQGNVNNNAITNFNQNSNGTYAGVMSGSGSLTKDGTGTLTLSGDNTYTGGTVVNAGTLSGNTQSIQGNVNNNAITNFNQNSNGTYAGVMSGSGSLTKDGTGTLTLSGDNTYTGGTVVNAGGLNFLNPAITNVAIAGAGTVFGNIAVTGNVSNAGNIQPSFDGAPSNLTIVGNYVGNGGTFTTQVHAPTTSPIADQLTISGAGNSGSGNTGINVVDRGGLGNATTGDGIVLVNAVNGATTSSGSFALTGRVASGAYEYQLYRGDKAGNGGAWYLRTEEENPPPVPVTPVASQRIEVALYPALPSLVRLYSMTVVDTLDQRRGDLNLVDPQGATKGGTNDWARIIGKTGTSTPSTVGDGPKMNFNAYALQFGVDLYRNERLDGSRTYIGPYATIGNANGGVSNQAGTTNTGNIGMQAYSLGLYATHFASNGLYVDALAQGSRYLRAQAISVENAQIQTQGTGFTGSLEAGSRWSVGEKWIISPQAQIVYDSIGMNNASDSYGQMNFAKDETSRGRLGVMLGHQDLKAKVPVFAYLRASVWDVFQSGSNTTFQSLYGVNPVSFQSQTGSRWLAIDAQIGARLSQHTNVFINAGWENSLVGTYQAISGRIGIQTRF